MDDSTIRIVQTEENKSAKCYELLTIMQIFKQKYYMEALIVSQYNTIENTVGLLLVSRSVLLIDLTIGAHIYRLSRSLTNKVI